MFKEEILTDNVWVKITTAEQDVALRTWAHEQGFKWLDGASYFDKSGFTRSPIIMNIVGGQWCSCGTGDNVITYEDALLPQWPMFKKEILTDDVWVEITTAEQDLALRKWAHEQGMTWIEGCSFLERSAFDGDELFLNIKQGQWSYHRTGNNVISYEEALLPQEWPQRMQVSKDGYTWHEDKVIGQLSHNGVYVSTLCDTYPYAKPIAKTRPMTLAEKNQWWWDQVRAGNNPAVKNRGEVFFVIIIDLHADAHYCANYTGTDSDEWVSLEVTC